MRVCVEGGEFAVAFVTIVPVEDEEDEEDDVGFAFSCVLEDKCPPVNILANEENSRKGMRA